MNRDMAKRLFRSTCLFFLISLLAFTASCTGTLPKEYTAAEKLWESRGLKNYDFTLQRQCFCPEDIRGPVNIQVRNGTAVNVTYTDTGASVTGGKFEQADTVDKLFLVLKNAYTGKNEFNQKAFSVNVTYDPHRGYPLDFYIDIAQTIADEEQGYTVTNFVVR